MSTLTRPHALLAPVALAVAAVGGLASGVLTSVLQGVLPGNWNVLANSGAVWTVVAFGLALLCAELPGGEQVWTAVAAGTLALLGEVAGYYAIAMPWRDLATSPSERVLWTCAALVVGPLTGLAARWARRGTSTERTVAVLGLCGVVAGEAWHTLARVPGHERAGRVELVLAVTVAVATLLFATQAWRARALGLVTGLVTAAAVAAVYGAPLLF